jgi:uncharacterized protein YbjT (DUF2867 family)
MLEDGVAVSAGSFMQRHMINKRSIEKMVEDGGFESYTLLRPTFFMANFLEPKNKRYTEIRDKHQWTTAFTLESEFPLADHEDIAKFTIAALQDPEKYHGRALSIASDQLKIQDILDQLADAIGRPHTIRAKFLTDEEVEEQEKSTGFSNTHKSLRVTSNYINLEELREMVPLTSFKEFLQREIDVVKKTYPQKID